jgi:hypothetical protein
MKALKNLLVFMIVLFPMVALADAAADMPVDTFLGEVFAAIKNLGGLPWAGKVASVCLLLVASMKVSLVRPLWDKLGNAKVFAAPALAIVGGVLSLEHITAASVMAYMLAGAGAIALHQILDAVKALPGVGSMYVAMIDLVSGLLKKPGM